MDWTQLISLAGYTTATCYFFYRLNEKSIDKIETGMDRIEQRFEERRDKNETHWREMFMYMSGRIDGSKETDTKSDQVLSKK